ncbi:MAG: hypothetical protein MJ239_05315 [Bacilli bacterium]|nr:hypothetical protein [Bacilli bacterium]
MTKEERIAKRKQRRYRSSTILGAAFSIIVGLILAFYNIALGLIGGAVWNLSIGIYYVFLSVIRSIIVSSQTKRRNRDEIKGAENRRKVYVTTYILIFIMNIALAAPIAMMVLGMRNVNTGLIPAIAQATYTTYRIVTSISHYNKSKLDSNILVHELRTINLIDSLVAVLCLQNVLIVAAGGDTESMLRFTACTSAAILLAILIINIVNFFKYKNK